MVPADSDRIPRAPPYSGYSWLATTLRVRDFHPLRRAFPGASTSLVVRVSESYNPEGALTPPVWALSVSLATTPEIDAFFLFLQVLRCFSSLRFRLPRRQAFSLPGSPIRTSADHFLLADPRGFSQLATSFVVFGSLGIPRSPLFSSSINVRFE